jgi:hypothetical protein
MPLADTLLRLAEVPRLYLPRWSAEIMTEVSNNLMAKLGLTKEQVHWREEQIRTHFPECWVEGYEQLIPVMQNQVKDRHVLAAAVRCGAELIVTFNMKDFHPDILSTLGLERQGPSTFLRNLYDLEPGIVTRKLISQAEDTGRSLEDLLRSLRVNVPGFVTYFCEEQKIHLG